MADNFRPGDHYITDDRTGLKIRASEARREWTGQIVHKDGWEPRQPQDLVRGKVDQLTVRDARPRPVDVFIGPLISFIAVAASAGENSLRLESAARMRQGDRLHILLDNSDTFRVEIASVTNETDIMITSRLPWAVSVGNQVTDYTAMAEPDLP